MQFLRSKSLHLYQDILPDAPSTLTNRIVNFLSFYLSYNGQHQYYSPHLHSQSYLQRHFAQHQQPHNEKGNAEHLFAKMLLATGFQEQVVDVKGTFRLLSDLYALSSVDGKDIAESFLKVQCKDIKPNQSIQMATKPLPEQRRRNIYVAHQRVLPGVEQLTQMITLNPFYRLPNLNKIMVFKTDPAKSLQLPVALENYCQQHSVKIKLFEEAGIESLIEYIYKKSKGKILIHENINFDKSIYDLRTPPNQQRVVNGKVINPINTRFMPQEVLLMAQRLPLSSLATPNTKNVILTQMKQLLDLEEHEELIDPIKRISISALEKNYRHEEQSASQESKLGFVLRRYVTEQVYALNRKSDINTPFTNPK